MAVLRLGKLVGARTAGVVSALPTGYRLDDDSLLGLTGLDYEPEPWSTADSLAWLKAMAWDLRGNMQDEVDRALALADHTPAQVEQALVRQAVFVSGAVSVTRPAAMALAAWT